MFLFFLDPFSELQTQLPLAHLYLNINEHFRINMYDVKLLISSKYNMPQ